MPPTARAISDRPDLNRFHWRAVNGQFVVTAGGWPGKGPRSSDAFLVVDLGCSFGSGFFHAVALAVGETTSASWTSRSIMAAIPMPITSERGGLPISGLLFPRNRGPT